MIFPGIIIALFFIGFKNVNFIKIIFAFFATCIISSANYILNEYLDKDYDKFHPEKKHRPLVENDVSSKYIIIEYIIFSVVGLIFSKLVSKYMLYLEIWLLIMGIIYNVKPFRIKEVPILDVAIESVNNVIRLLIGWFVITDKYLPPVSIVIAYWLLGAFLMNTKRLAEYKAINNKNIASLYRKSFSFYNEKRLLLISIFYAILTVYFWGIFIIKYKLELIITVPFIAFAFCYYMNLAFKENSVCDKPEKLYKEKFFMLMVFGIFVITSIILNFNIPVLNIFLNNNLIPI